MTNKMSLLTRNWVARKLSLKGREEVVHTYITYVTYYCLTTVSCPDSYLVKLERSLFKFLWRRQIPIVKWFICCQHLLRGELGLPWLLMYRYALWLGHRQILFVDGEQV